MGSQKVLKYLGTAQTLTSLAQSKARVWGPTSGRWERCCQTSPCPEMAQEQENQDPNSRDSQGDCRSTARPQVLLLLQKCQSYPQNGQEFILLVHIHGDAAAQGGCSSPSLKWWGLPHLCSLQSGGIKQKSRSTLHCCGGKSPAAMADSFGAPEAPVPPLFPWESPQS